MATKLKTIDLKGKKYTLVNSRVEYFNETYPNGMIATKATFQPNGECLFTAKVIPDAKEARYFNGSSYGKVAGEKALEKLETVAVGRALAFMGIGVTESIASADEINTWQSAKNTAKPVTAQPSTSDKPYKHSVAGCRSGLAQMPSGEWICDDANCTNLNG